MKYNLKEVLCRPEHDRKVQLCRHVLDVLTAVDPGFTKWRGTVLQVVQYYSGGEQGLSLPPVPID